MRLKKKKINPRDYTAMNQVKLVRGGRDYFKVLIDLVEHAKSSIHLQTYIYEDDSTGKQVAEALKAAAKRNVAVYLIADGYASKGMASSFIDSLTDSGIHFRFFEPVFKSRYFYFGRRMHHKILVIDAMHALVGGVNISDRYNDMPAKPAWLDFALHVKGETAKILCELCAGFWKGGSSKILPPACNALRSPESIPEQNRSEVRIRRNDWVRRKNDVSATYIEMLRNARSEITILSSYFLPGKFIRKQMVKAVKRGVNIRVIAAGSSDVMLAKHAERWLYDWLLRNGITLYEYQKNILHGKMAVCDTSWMTIGSYNINNLSAYASIELNLDVKDPAFAGTVRETLEAIIEADCIPITTSQLVKTKNIFRQFIRWVSYELIKVLLYLFTFYFKRRG